MINANILPKYIYTGLSTKYLIQVVFKFTQFMNLRFHKCTHTLKAVKVHRVFVDQSYFPCALTYKLLNLNGNFPKY